MLRTDSKLGEALEDDLRQLDPLAVLNALGRPTLRANAAPRNGHFQLTALAFCGAAGSAIAFFVCFSCSEFRSSLAGFRPHSRAVSCPLTGVSVSCLYGYVSRCGPSVGWQLRTMMGTVSVRCMTSLGFARKNG